MFKIHFLLLIKRLQELNAPERTIGTTNWYRGQDKIKGGLKTDKSVFVKFLNTPTADLGNGIQEANLKFELHCFSTNTHKDNKRVSESGHFEFVEEVYKNIHGFCADFSDYDNSVDSNMDYRVLNTISRTGVAPSHDSRNVMGTVISFTSYIEDRSAIEYYIPYTGDATIDIENWEI